MIKYLRIRSGIYGETVVSPSRIASRILLEGAATAAPHTPERERRRVKCLLASIFIAAALLTACHPRPATAPTFQQSASTVSTLEQQYGRIKSQPVDAYFAYLMQRLFSHQAHGFNVVALATDTPLALGLGGGYVAVSRGLVKAVASEDELAFILAHECAHELLEHHASQRSQQLEMEADRFALRTIVAAGYDPGAAAEALSATYFAGLVAQQRVGKLSEVHERASQMAEMSCHFKGGGTLNRREFWRMRAAL